MDTPTFWHHVRSGTFSKRLVMANHTHTWWQNMSPLTHSACTTNLHTTVLYKRTILFSIPVTTSNRLDPPPLTWPHFLLINGLLRISGSVCKGSLLFLQRWFYLNSWPVKFGKNCIIVPCFLWEYRCNIVCKCTLHLRYLLFLFKKYKNTYVIIKWISYAVLNNPSSGRYSSPSLVRVQLFMVC